MNWGIVVLAFLVYAGLAGIAVVGLCLSTTRSPTAQLQSRLGHSVWLCRDCHAFYARPITRCPQGHQVIEASAWRPEIGKEDDALPRSKTDSLLQ